jgi:polyphenol oxidase
VSPASAAPTLQARIAGDVRVRTAFSERRQVGNVSRVVGGGDVDGARHRLTGLVGLPPERAVFMEQVHGPGVAVVDDRHAGRGLTSHGDAVEGVDALVTAAEDLALVVMVADCVPVLLALPGRAIAAAHAGRRGIETEVLAATVARLVDVGQGAAGEVEALIGPAIGGCCYEVPADLAEAVAGRWPAARARTTWGTPAIDLPAAARAQLAAAGVQRVDTIGSCTRCDADRWFSHRADSAAGAAAVGRQAGVIARVSAAGSDRSPSLD